MKKCTELSIFKNFAEIDSSKIETFNTNLMLVIESVNSALPDNDFSCLISSQRHIYRSQKYTLQEDLKETNTKSVRTSFIPMADLSYTALSFRFTSVSDYGDYYTPSKEQQRQTVADIS